MLKRWERRLEHWFGHWCLKKICWHRGLLVPHAESGRHAYTWERKSFIGDWKVTYICCFLLFSGSYAMFAHCSLSSPMLSFCFWFGHRCTHCGQSKIRSSSCMCFKDIKANIKSANIIQNCSHSDHCLDLFFHSETNSWTSVSPTLLSMILSGISRSPSQIFASDQSHLGHVWACLDGRMCPAYMRACA